MGGRKSVELSHINYTEVLKQCLAAVRNFSFKEIFLALTGAQCLTISVRLSGPNLFEAIIQSNKTLSYRRSL